MKLKTLAGIATLGMIVTLCKAELTEDTAKKALEKQIQTMEFRVADGAPAMTNLAWSGGPANRIVEVGWQKPRKEKIKYQEWTVFVADALVETYHGKYRVKAGVGLQQKGDDVFMCEAFDPVIQRVQATPQEEEAMKKEGDRRQRVEALLNNILPARWNQKPRDLGEGAAVSVVFSPNCLPGGSAEFYGKPYRFTFVTADKTGSEFPLSATQEELVQVSGFLSKFAEWAKTSADKHVESFKKDIGEIEQFDPNIKPGALFTFIVDEHGVQSLRLYAMSDMGGRAIRLTTAQAEHLAAIVSGFPSELTALVKEAESEEAKQANSTAEKDALFK